MARGAPARVRSASPLDHLDGGHQLGSRLTKVAGDHHGSIARDPLTFGSRQTDRLQQVQTYLQNRGTKIADRRSNGAAGTTPVRQSPLA